MKKESAKKFLGLPLEAYLQREFGHEGKSLSSSGNISQLTNQLESQGLEELEMHREKALSLQRRGNYCEAISCFRLLLDNHSPSIIIDGCLGIASCLLHLGYLASGAKWASLAMAIARNHELSFQMAKALWIRGNALLRSNLPKDAYDLFMLDFSILPPGHPQRPWALCMMAYSLGKLQGNFLAASETLFRVAAHMHSKDDPKWFAY